MSYHFSEAALLKNLKKKGFKNISDFIKKTKVNRATLYNYLQGQPVFSAPFLKIAAQLGVSPITLLEMEEAPGGPVPPVMVKSMVTHATQHPQIGVFLFGSRQAGAVKSFSDWDLGLATSYGNLNDSLFLDLKHAAEQLAEDSLETIDLVNLDCAPSWFIDGIAKKPLFLGGNLIARNRFFQKWEACHGKTEAQRVS